MDTYGHIIKFERIRQNVKQAQLSEGICSPAYLSKIESNSIVPSVQVRDALFKRLNIKPSTPSMSEDDYLKHVHTIYFEAIMYKDRQKTATFLEELQKTQFLFINPSNFYTFQLKILRLSLIAFNSQKPTQDIIKSISLMKKDFNDYQNFMFKLNLGFFNFMNQNHLHSLKFLEDAFDLVQRVKCEAWETADLEYALALVYLSLDRNVNSIEFNEKAVLFFEREFYYKRAIESYIILGIVYRRIEKHKEAVEILQLAKKISIELNIKDNYPHVFFNLGTIASEQGDLDLAIESFEEALNLRSDIPGKVLCLYALMLVYAKKKDTDSVIFFCKKGIELCNNEQDNLLENTIHHFNCYLSRFSKFENFEETFKTAVSYFDKKNENQYSHKYSLQLAQYYLANKKYKNAATYFSLANEFLAKKESRNYSEDI